jgi:hypothetical protein
MVTDWREIAGTWKWVSATSRIPEFGSWVIRDESIEIAGIDRPAIQADWWPGNEVAERIEYLRDTNGLQYWGANLVGIDQTAQLLVANREDEELFSTIALGAWLLDRLKNPPGGWYKLNVDIVRDVLGCVRPRLLEREVVQGNDGLSRMLPLSFLDGQFSYVPESLDQLMYLAATDLLANCTLWQLISFHFVPIGITSGSPGA